MQVELQFTHLIGFAGLFSLLISSIFLQFVSGMTRFVLFFFHMTVGHLVTGRISNY